MSDELSDLVFSRWGMTDGAGRINEATGMVVTTIMTGGSNGPFSYTEHSTEDGYMQCAECGYHWELHPGERIWANDHRLCTHGRPMFTIAFPRTCEEAGWRCRGICTKNAITGEITDRDCIRTVHVPPGCEVSYD